MSKAPIEVRVHARGSVRDGSPTNDPRTKASCDLCGAVADAVVSVSAQPGSFACKNCLRERLESVTLALWMLKEGSGLPWGKISG